MITSCRVFILMLVTGSAGCSDAANVPVDRMNLPKALQEISGLTLGSEQTLLAIADEVGWVYELDMDQVSADRLVSFEEPAAKADFEGLSRRGDVLYALTSKGHIYQRHLADGSQTHRLKTGLGNQCEFEGLVADPAEPVLWLLCKQAQKKKLKGKLNIFAWREDSGRVDEALSLHIPFQDLGIRAISPSGMDLNEAGFLIVAARERAFLEIKRDGTFVRAGRLPAADAHPQAEGVVRSGATIYVADEGGGGSGVLSRYVNGF